MGHSLSAERNGGPLVLAQDTIGKDLKVSLDIGGVELEQDLIAGKAECVEDTPAPGGSGNSVAGLDNGCPL